MDDHQVNPSITTLNRVEPRNSLISLWRGRRTRLCQWQLLSTDNFLITKIDFVIADKYFPSRRHRFGGSPPRVHFKSRKLWHWSSLRFLNFLFNLGHDSTQINHQPVPGVCSRAQKQSRMNFFLTPLRYVIHRLINHIKTQFSSVSAKWGTKTRVEILPKWIWRAAPSVKVFKKREICFVAYVAVIAEITTKAGKNKFSTQWYHRWRCGVYRLI